MGLQLKANEIDIPKGNPFANDKLNRKKCADVLSGLITDYHGSLVISINSGWGTGKTTFLKMWNQDLNDKGYSTIMFNAWNEDYCNDALVALIGRLSDVLPKLDASVERKARDTIQVIKKIGGHFLKNSIPAVIRIATVGAVNLDNKEIEKVIEGNLGDAVSSVAEEVIKEYEDSHSKLSEFKSKLHEFADFVSGKDKPLILIIDELDRCRPLFAIEVLEKAKHLFDIPGIIFVLGVDKEQLGHSIRSVYGQGMDVDGYLRRLVDIEFVLPAANTKIFFKHVVDQLGLTKHFQDRSSMGDLETIGDIFSALCGCFNLSLRDIEHCARLLVLACKNTSESRKMFPVLLSALIILKLVNSRLYCDYISGQCTSENIIEFILKHPTGKAFLSSWEGIQTEAYLLATFPTEWRDAVLSQVQLKRNHKPLTAPQFLPKRYAEMSGSHLEQLVDCTNPLIKDYRSRLDIKVIGYLSEKIDLSSLMLGYRE